MQEMIALYRLDMVWQQKQKHHAETRDPTSQDPRDHMAQADRHNNSPIVTSKQTTTTPRRNESGEKKVKRTVKPGDALERGRRGTCFGNALVAAVMVTARPILNLKRVN
jgi:hypothetical protein